MTQTATQTDSGLGKAEISENERQHYPSSIGNLTGKLLRELLEYDPDVGTFTWRVTTGLRGQKGTVAGSVNASGYIRINIKGTRYMAHRLAWLYIHDEWTMVDHIDRNRSNNVISNLRRATYQQNAANREFIGNNSGEKGVYFRNGKYEVGIKVDQQRIYIGRFWTLKEASDAYKNAAAYYFGEFANG